MADFYGIGPRNKRFGHICYYCELGKYDQCEARKNQTKDITQHCDCSCYKNENIEGFF